MWVPQGEVAVSYTVFLGFEIDTQDKEEARCMAREMIEREREFPTRIGCVGVETPPCGLDPVEYLITLAFALEEESRHHAAQNN